MLSRSLFGRVSALALVSGIVIGANGSALAGFVEINTLFIEGDQATADSTFSFLLDPVINNNGDIAFLGGTASSVQGGSFSGLFQTRNGTLETTLRGGDPINGGGTVTGFIQGPKDINDRGDLIVEVVDPSGPSGPVVSSFRNTNAGLELLTRVGDPSPTRPGAQILSAGRASLNAQGEALFDIGSGTPAVPPNPPSFAGSDIVRTGPGGQTSVIASGFDSNTGIFTGSFNRSDQNSNGDFASTTFLSGLPGGVPSGPKLVVSDGSGGLQILAGDNDVLSNGTQITNSFFSPNLFEPVDLNNNGEVALDVATTAVAGTSNNSGVLKAGPSGIEIVAFEGDAAPGTAETFGAFSSVNINDQGQVAFGARFGGSATPIFAFDGIFSTDPLGDVVSIITAGELLEVAPGDAREVLDLGFVAGAALNDLGDLVFRARFTDNSEGIFSASLATTPVPVPAALPLLLAAFGLLGIVARRRNAVR